MIPGASSPEEAQRWVDASRLIASNAMRYARRCSSEEHEGDLIAAAWVELLKDAWRWNAERGPWEGFVLSVICHAIRRELYTLRAPVSGSAWRAGTWSKGLSAASDDDLAMHTEARTMSQPPPAPDAYAIGAEFLEAVRDTLMDTPGAELALAVLLHDKSPQQVAREHRVPVRRVNLALREARARARQTLGHFNDRPQNDTQQEESDDQ